MTAALAYLTLAYLAAALVALLIAAWLLVDTVRIERKAERSAS